MNIMESILNDVTPAYDADYDVNVGYIANRYGMRYDNAERRYRRVKYDLNCLTWPYTVDNVRKICDKFDTIEFYFGKSQ